MKRQGNGSTNPPRRNWRSSVALFIIISAALVPVAAHAASPPLLAKFCKGAQFELYEARVNGGFPAPNDPTPASSSFQGAGNVTEPTAKKKHQHKKAKKQKHRHRAKKSHGRANHNRRNGR
jgi:hypothetical protein